MSPPVAAPLAPDRRTRALEVFQDYLTNPDAAHDRLWDAHAGMIRELFLNDPYGLFYFAQGVFGFPDLKFEIHGHVARQVWDWGSDGLRRLMIQLPREFFKCRRAGSLVHTPSGVTEIEKLVPGDAVYAMDDELKLAERRVLHTRLSEAPLLRVTLHNGVIADVTENHPFLTVRGWVEARMLEQGFGIAVPSRMPAPPVTGSRPYTAGALCGDGCASNCSITCFDPEILEQLRREGVEYTARNVKGTYGVGKRYWHPELLCGAWGKRIPRDYEGSAEFLQGLFDTDGTVGRAIVLVTVSEQLARDAQRNLLYFGVRSTIKRYRSQGPNGYRSFAWHLIIGDSESARAFESRIGFTVARKQDGLRRLACRTRDPRTSTRKTAIPPEWRDLLLRRAVGRRGGFGDIRKLRELGLRVDNDYWTSRDKVMACASALGRPDIARLCGNDVAWEGVLSVERIGVHPIVEIEVEGGTYFCEGVLDHNTSLITRAGSLWLLCRGPSEPVVVVNEREENTKKWGRSIKDTVAGSRLFHAVFPDMCPPGIGPHKADTMPRSWRWRDDMFDLPGRELGEPEASWTGLGVGSGSTGGHWPRILYDDIIGRDAANSAAIMADARDFVDKTPYLMRPAEHGNWLCACTHWTYDDAYVHMIRKYDFTVYRRAALEDGESIFPEKLDTPTLLAMQQRDPYSFSSSMMNRPAAGRDQSFQAAWMRYFTLDTSDPSEPAIVIERDSYVESACDANIDETPPLRVPLRWCDRAQILDPAPSDPKKLSNTASRNGLVQLARDPWGRTFVLNCWAERADPLTVLNKAFEWAPLSPRFGIEEVNFSIIYVPFFSYVAKHQGIPLQLFALPTRGRDKDARIVGLIPGFRNGFWYLNRPRCAALVQELLEYPYGATVDLVDAAAYADEALSRPETPDEWERRVVRQRRQAIHGRDPVTGYSATM